MAYDENLADRIRLVLNNKKISFDEKKIYVRTFFYDG